LYLFILFGLVNIEKTVKALTFFRRAPGPHKLAQWGGSGCTICRTRLQSYEKNPIFANIVALFFAIVLFLPFRQRGYVVRIRGKKNKRVNVLLTLYKPRVLSRITLLKPRYTFDVHISQTWLISQQAYQLIMADFSTSLSAIMADSIG